MTFGEPYSLPIALSFGDVLLVPQFSKINSRSDINLSQDLGKGFILKNPIMPTNMDSITGVEMALKMGEMGGIAVFPRFDAPEIQAEKIHQVKSKGFKTCASVGVKEGEKERAEILINAGLDIINVDVAHGHMQKMLDMTSYLKNKYPDKIIYSGVVATYDGANNLFIAGADIVDVGIGGGSICTTRIQTGHGLPQISQLFDCAKAARKHKKFITSNGGIENSGDIVKALAAGASAVRVGSLIAGTDECPGNIIEVDGKKYKEYNGSTSLKEKKKQMEKFSKEKDVNYVHHIEGVEAMVEYRGSITDLMERLLAGVKSGLTYSGAKTIPELWKKAKFVQITQAGRYESGAHNVILQKS